MKKIKELIKKIFTKEIMLYAIFGVLTTLVNICSFAIMTKALNWEENLSNFIAIVLAVLFAYVTNKYFVFQSKTEGFKEGIFEFAKFVLGRAFTMVVELIGGFILFKLPIPTMISKFVIAVIVIILNFFISKFYTFKNIKNKKCE